MKEIFQHIDDHLNDSIAVLTELCKLPSVSAQGTAIEQTSEHVEALLKDLGFETNIMPKPKSHETGASKAQPVVFAELQGESPKTLMFYDHYDVQPAEPLDLWTTPPFQPTLRDGKLYARGVSDNKGNIAARLAAVKAWRDVKGKLPCSIKFCIEGDEEIGSPQMEEFVDEHQNLLSADACQWEGGGVTWEGVPQVTFGVKGLLYVELECETVNSDAHSSYATVLPNAAWRLVWALSTIKDRDERVLIDGFYDSVRPATPEERAALAAIPSEEAETLESYGIERAVADVSGLDYTTRYLMDPTGNIAGLTSGYEDEGAKTVLPAKALAKMDFRLVPDQDPDEIVELLTHHLASSGFEDVKVRLIAGERPARTPVTDPFVQVMRDAVRAAYDAEPIILPTMAGTGPLHPFVETLGLPTGDCGIGYPDAKIHAPNENIRIEDFRNGTKAVAALIGRFAE
jgi:acetylornithine deacetylase/succinyl-diaminopimelate desuccinylase-like protein